MIRIYAACLASYNNGRLHGDWIDCEGKSADELQDEVNAILRASPYPNVTVTCPDCDGDGSVLVTRDTPSEDEITERHECRTCKGSGDVPSAEEMAIHDHEGFGDLVGEYTSLAEVAKHAERITEHGEAWIAYAGDVGGEPSEDDFNDCFNGVWDSEEKFAEHLIDEGALGEIPEALQYYIDVEKFARDLFINDYWRDDATGAVFRR